MDEQIAFHFNEKRYQDFRNSYHILTEPYT